MDTIIGAQHKGAIVSMVDRATKLTQLIKLDHKTAEEVTDALITKLGPIKEFAYHQSVSLALEADFFFCNSIPFMGERIK